MSDAFPDVVLWTIPKNPRPGVEPRVYEQREFGIDGEMLLFGLLARTVERLRKEGFDFAALLSLFPDVDETDPDALAKIQAIDFGRLSGLLTTASSVAPFLLSEGAATLLGIYPVDHLGVRNPAYVDEVAFLRKWMHLADVVEMLEIAWSQNDVKRLTGPFVRVAKEVMYQYGGATTTTEAPTIEPSPAASTSSSAPDTGLNGSSDGTTRGEP